MPDWRWRAAAEGERRDRGTTGWRWAHVSRRRWQEASRGRNWRRTGDAWSALECAHGGGCPGKVTSVMRALTTSGAARECGAAAGGAADWGLQWSARTREGSRRGRKNALEVWGGHWPSE